MLTSDKEKDVLEKKKGSDEYEVSYLRSDSIDEVLARRRKMKNSPYRKGLLEDAKKGLFLDHSPNTK